MSYRAFKRLLGETSLERKCRFLFGGFILLLITASFWLYAHLTYALAYAQIDTTCRLLVNPIVAQEHLTVAQEHLPRDQQKALDALKKQWKKDSGDEAAPRAPDYHHHFLKP